ncbi:histidine phosphatase family protein [Cesiribacter sp. SM1]|uniref:histidine phosphatase family protein n=1 Tax=Cesiribacter sp. SM1 TaxID=2861196 RepID=UPI001CD7D53D|nr:histidine phosphatase family protein [Cesiribacter sp. SM1]
MQEQILNNLEIKYKELNRNADFVTANGVPVAQELHFVEPNKNLLPENAQVRQIALIRHGEPDLTKTGQFTYEEAKSFIRNYDSVGIIIPDRPFFKLNEAEEVALFTSTIPRAQATAKYLFGAEREIVITEDFREFERIIGKRRVKMRLPLKYWTTTARIKWMLGLDREGIESFSEAKERARKGAMLLDESSEEIPKVVLVAHGFLNRYIRKNLEELGWRVVRDGGDNYFATTILAKIDTEEDRNDTNLVTESDN